MQHLQIRMVVSCCPLGVRINLASSRIWPNGAFDFVQKLLQIGPLEKSVAISRISVHWNGTGSRPFAERVLRNTQDICRLSCLHVVSQLLHWMPPSSRGSIIAVEVYKSLQAGYSEQRSHYRQSRTIPRFRMQVRWNRACATW